MFIITYKMPKELVDEKIELLQINDIFNGFYVPQLITLKIKKKFSLLLKVPLELDYMKLLRTY